MKKTFVVTDIKYDTDGEKVSLPKEMTIEVPEDLTEYEEIEEFISDEITNRTGFCHMGFKTTPEIELDMKKEKEVEQVLFSIYNAIGIDKPENHEDILNFCVEDVEETADKENWHSGDVAIAFRRFLEKK